MKKSDILKILDTGSMVRHATELVAKMPARLGPYRILERIGEGGMGVVYLAEQDPPLARRVAVKLARNAVLVGRALARFESERQTLAVMNHPNIAQVFDAGSTPDSRPYFVMEYVAGESITEFCDSRRLGIETRLELFLRVCEGMQHAHLNGVIHRDLKPANILVSTASGPPTPKIIDFGVAKALHDGAAASDGPTLFGHLVGTPEYMSPEQAALDGHAVDSRTDVYSLGIVLYELLVGGRPFERRTGRDDSFVDLCRRIREDEPERPSVRALRASAMETARRLHDSARALARRLRGDLDAIVIKALAKDPGSRYATPSDMAADIERHLQHRPIRARAPGAYVRLLKAVRRHRRAAVIVTILSGTLIGFAYFGTLQALRARRESARAEEEARIQNEVRQLVLGVIAPTGSLIMYNWQGTFTAQDRAALLDRIRERFADKPVLQSQLLFAAGTHLVVATQSRRDLETLRESRDLMSSLLGSDSAEVLAASEGVAYAYMFGLQYEEAERLLLDVIERRRRLVGGDHPDTLRTTAQLASVYKYRQRHDQAASLFESVIAGLSRQLGPDHPDVLSAKVGLSGSYLELRRYQETRVLLEHVIDRIRQVFGERDYQTTVALYNLACVHANSERLELAFDFLRQSIDAGFCYPGGLAQDPQLLALHADPRFDALDRAGRLNDRRSWARQLHDAESLIRGDRLGDAERVLLALIAAVEAMDQTGAGGWAYNPRLALANCWILQRRFDDAEELLLPTLAAVRTERSPEDESRVHESLAQCDIGRGRRDSALSRIAAASSLVHPLHGIMFQTYRTAQSEALRGRYEDALRSLARASELGFEDVHRLEHDLAFEKLRDRAEFRTIAGVVRKRER